MSFGASYLGPKSFSRHLTRRKTARSAAPSLAMSLMLTPFIDCFSILVIFLLNQMSTDAEALKLAQAIELPSARSAVSLEKSLSITLRPDSVSVGDRRLAPLKQVLADPSILKKALPALGNSKVVLQADTALPSASVVSVIQQLSMLGYPAVQLAVVPGQPLARKEAP